MVSVTRRAALASLALLTLAQRAVAQVRPLPPELATALPGARLIGSGTLRYFGFRVYDIRLWAPAPVGHDQGWLAMPLALEIQYARALVGQQIADRSLTEMRRQANVSDEQASRWRAAMAATFPDVKAGDRITGLYKPGAGAHFFVNGRDGGEVVDPQFARLFFGIWLSARTSEPDLREQLLSAAP